MNNTTTIQWTTEFGIYPIYFILPEICYLYLIIRGTLSIRTNKPLNHIIFWCTGLFVMLRANFVGTEYTYVMMNDHKSTRTYTFENIYTMTVMTKGLIKLIEAMFFVLSAFDLYIKKIVRPCIQQYTISKKICVYLFFFALYVAGFFNIGTMMMITVPYIGIVIIPACALYAYLWIICALPLYFVPKYSELYAVLIRNDAPPEEVEVKIEDVELKLLHVISGEASETFTDTPAVYPNEEPKCTCQWKIWYGLFCWGFLLCFIILVLPSLALTAYYQKDYTYGFSKLFSFDYIKKLANHYDAVQFARIIL
jgi:hypothetical protein